MGKIDLDREGLVLTVSQLAARLGLTERAIRGRVARHLIPFKKMGARVVFLGAEIDAWLASLPGCSLAEVQQNVDMRRGGS